MRVDEGEGSPGAVIGLGPERLELNAGAQRLVGDLWQGDCHVGDVLLLHGGGQTRFAWQGTAGLLAARCWTTIAYDARGHGESAWSSSGAYEQDALLGDLSRVVALTATPPVVVGASMGGMTSLIAAGEHTIPIRALVLVDIALRVDTAEADRVQAFMAANLDGFPDLAAVADAVQAYNPLRPRPPSPEGLKRNVMQRADGRWYWRWDPRLLDQKRAIMPLGERLRRAARNVAVPTLLIRGKRSHMISDAGLAEFREHIPHAEIADIAEAGHMVAGDDNDAFAAAITRFLDNLPPLAR